MVSTTTGHTCHLLRTRRSHTSAIRGLQLPRSFLPGSLQALFRRGDLGGDVSAEIQARSDHCQAGVGAEAGASHNALVTMPQVLGGVFIEFNQNSYPVRPAEGRTLSG